MTDEARETLTWTAYGEAARELATTIAADGWVPDAIVAIARGGLPLAGSLAYALDVKPLGSLNVEFMTGVGTHLPDPVVLPPLLDRASLAGRRVLLVDDVSDSGRTLALVLELLRSVAGEVRTVCLYTKPGTVHEPHYSWRRTDRWILFPWSADGPVAGARSGVATVER
ncbi:MAG: phosphoribosyltransferase [Micrococcales bacterium]|nr:phosphoribosyltransferase [Micrococcales bacterium]